MVPVCRMLRAQPHSALHFRARSGCKEPCSKQNPINAKFGAFTAFYAQRRVWHGTADNLRQRAFLGAFWALIYAYFAARNRSKIARSPKIGPGNTPGATVPPYGIPCRGRRKDSGTPTEFPQTSEGNSCPGIFELKSNL